MIYSIIEDLFSKEFSISDKTKLVLLLCNIALFSYFELIFHGQEINVHILFSLNTMMLISGVIYSTLSKGCDIISKYVVD